MRTNPNQFVEFIVFEVCVPLLLLIPWFTIHHTITYTYTLLHSLCMRCIRAYSEILRIHRERKRERKIPKTLILVNFLLLVSLSLSFILPCLDMDLPNECWSNFGQTHYAFVGISTNETQNTILNPLINDFLKSL